MLTEIKDKIPKIKDTVVFATTSYIKYYQENHTSWNANDIKIAEETVGVLVLGGQKLNSFMEHFNKHDTLPPEIPTEIELDKFVSYFEVISNAVLKQVPKIYQN